MSPSPLPMLSRRTRLVTNCLTYVQSAAFDGVGIAMPSSNGSQPGDTADITDSSTRSLAERSISLQCPAIVVCLSSVCDASAL